MKLVKKANGQHVLATNLVGWTKMVIDGGKQFLTDITFQKAFIKRLIQTGLVSVSVLKEIIMEVGKQSLPETETTPDGKVKQTQNPYDPMRANDIAGGGPSSV